MEESVGNVEPEVANASRVSRWGTIGAIVFLIIWILIAFWPARVASSKGHSFLLYFILSLFFFPLALILAYVVGDRTR